MHAYLHTYTQLHAEIPAYIYIYIYIYAWTAYLRAWHACMRMYVHTYIPHPIVSPPCPPPPPPRPPPVGWGPVVVPFPIPALPLCGGLCTPLAEALVGLNWSTQHLQTQLLLHGTLRALVLNFSTTAHVYDCIYYGRAARIRRAVLEVITCFCGTGDYYCS